MTDGRCRRRDRLAWFREHLSAARPGGPVLHARPTPPLLLVPGDADPTVPSCLEPPARSTDGPHVQLRTVLAHPPDGEIDQGPLGHEGPHGVTHPPAPGGAGGLEGGAHGREVPSSMARSVQVTHRRSPSTRTALEFSWCAWTARWQVLGQMERRVAVVAHPRSSTEPPRS